MITNNSALIVPPPSPVVLTNDIRAIKPPVEIPNGWAWLGWTLAAAAILAIIGWAFVWWCRRQVAASVLPPAPPHVRAKLKLQAALALLSDPRLFCIEVSGILRVYLEERFNFRAPERTTDEFLVELQATSLLTPDQKQSLAEFLQDCDLVKFARFEPTQTALRGLLESALRLVDETQFEPIHPGPHSQPPPPSSTELPPLPSNADQPAGQRDRNPQPAVAARSPESFQSNPPSE
jgi:hypothetical protein